jgi:hypothetical protein
MNADEYTRTLRRVAVISWVGSLALFLGLAMIRIIPFSEFLPFIALIVGTVPIVLFMWRNRPACETCGGPMKASSGYPRISYRCTKCGAETDTGYYSD